MYPKTYFKNAQLMPQHTHCFVLMPFAEQFTEVFDAIIEALEDPEINFSCSRADDVFGGGHIIEDIMRGIGNAGIVIADVTTKNANVFYELGIAHMVKDIEKVIILTQNMDDVPFDLRHFRCIVYKQSDSGLRQLKRTLIRSIQDISKEAYRFSVKRGEVFQFTERLFGAGEDRSAYHFEITEILLLRNGAKFVLKVYQEAIGVPVKTVHSDSHGIKQGESMSMPNIPWRLVLERVSNDTAYFCLLPVSDTNAT